MVTTAEARKRVKGSGGIKVKKGTVLKGSNFIINEGQGNRRVKSLNKGRSLSQSLNNTLTARPTAVPINVNAPRDSKGNIITSTSPTSANAAALNVSSTDSPPLAQPQLASSEGSGFGGGGGGGDDQRWEGKYEGDNRILSLLDRYFNNPKRSNTYIDPLTGEQTTDLLGPMIGPGGGIGLGKGSLSKIGMNTERIAAQDAAKNTAGYYRRALAKKPEEYVLPKLSPTNNLKNLPPEVVEEVIKKGDPMINKIMTYVNKAPGRYVGEARKYHPGGTVAKNNALDKALKAKTGAKPITIEGSNIVPQMNLKTLIGKRRALFAAGAGLTLAFLLAKETGSSDVFSNFGTNEGIDKLSYARKEAIKAEGYGGPIVAEIDVAIDDYLNPEVREGILQKMPWWGGNVGTKKNFEAARTAADAYKKIDEIRIAGGGAETEMYRIAREEETAAQAARVDYFNEQQLITAEKIRLADAAADKKSSALWKQHQKDLDKETLIQAQKIANFWLEYHKKKNEMDLIEMSTYEPEFSNLGFGFI